MHSTNNQAEWVVYVRNCGWDYEQPFGCCKDWSPIQGEPMTWAQVVAMVATMDSSHREHAIVHKDAQHKYTGDNR